jgi:hypothetical protein
MSTIKDADEYTTIDITNSGDDTITIGTFDPSDYQIDLSALTGALANGGSSITSSITNSGNLSGAIGNYGNITINGTASVPYTYSTTASPWSSIHSGKLECDGDDADVVINGKSLKDFMTKMEQRMAILVPDPAKLEHFEALQKAYAHYKTLEALCEIPKPTEEE